MIEKTVLDYLEGALSVDVVTEQSNASTFVLIEKTGSTEQDHLYVTTIAIQSYAQSMYNASVLNESVKAAMKQMEDDLDCICSVEVNSDYNFTDTATKRYRYQAVFNIIHY